MQYAQQEDQLKQQYATLPTTGTTKGDPADEIVAAPSTSPVTRGGRRSCRVLWGLSLPWVPIDQQSVPEAAFWQPDLGDD